jgi:hypothetical protein
MALSALRGGITMCFEAQQALNVFGFTFWKKLVYTVPIQLFVASKELFRVA